MKMKTLTAALLLCAGALSAAEKSYPSFASKTAMLKIVTPNTIMVKLDGASSSSNNSKENKWLGIEFTYTARKAAKDEPRFIDDVRVVGTVVMESETPEGRPTFAVFSGETYLWHIQLDGRTRKILMLVPPQVVARYLVRSSNLTKTMAFARMQIYDAKGQLLAVEYATLNKVGAVKPEDVVADFQRIDQDPKSGYRIKNGLLPRSRTPWSLADYYNYDLEKDILWQPDNFGAAANSNNPGPGASGAAANSTNDGK